MRTRPLPTTVEPRPGESLDSFLVRLAAANAMPVTGAGGILDYTTLNVRQIRSNADFAGIRPPPQILEAVANQADLDLAAVIDLTLRRYAIDGRTGPDTRLPWRAPHTTAICPACMGEDPYYRLVWRLPQATVCPLHQQLLHRICPHCGQPFRRTHTTMTAHTLGMCGNITSGTGNYTTQCAYPLATLPQLAVTPQQLHAGTEIIHATETLDPVTAVGQTMSPPAYLTDLFAVTVLLIHLAAAGVLTSPPWTATIRDERPPTADSARTRLSPNLPQSTSCRTELLTTAESILAERDVNDAADHLATFYESAIPDCSAGPQAWLLSHTRKTPLLRQLIPAGLAPRRGIALHLSRRLPSHTRPAQSIPQMIPAHLYEQLFTGAFTVAPATGRQYLSLCLARRLPGIRTWAQAGQAIKIAPERANLTALEVSPRLTISNKDLLDRIQRLDDLLDPHTNYREREEYVRSLARNRAWYEHWRTEYQPRTKRTCGLPNACEWHWQNWALGQPFSQPWSHDWTRNRRHRYTEWARTLDDIISDTPSTYLLSETSSNIRSSGQIRRGYLEAKP